jgi:putative hydrolase of HD superfamily
MCDGEPDFLALVRRLEAGPGEVQEIISYVFEGEDPMQVDAKSFTPDEFKKIYPQLDSYGSGLAFDIVVRTEGHPLTVELTQGSRSITTNSLDREADLTELLGQDPLEENAGVDQEEMSPQDLLDILRVAERLKCATRHCDTSSGRRESVAEHSWRVALMAMLLSGQKEFADVNMDRVIRMCLIHDLGEAFTGDIPTFEKTKADEQTEGQAVRTLFASLPAPTGTELTAIFDEIDAQQTDEARLFRALDKFEAVIQHNESDIASWLPLEYDLQLTYGAEAASFSPYTEELRAALNAATRRKIADAKSEKVEE